MKSARCPEETVPDLPAVVPTGTRESATAKEPAVSLSAKPSGERKRKPVGGPETRVTPLPIESISATRVSRFQLQNRCAYPRL
ncbi:MAG: hypothetical protein WBP51_15795 [Candidatus Sulfotelmatobacter sp.]